VPTNVDSTPLSFLIRVADNLDAIYTRLTPVQNNASLMLYFFRIYADQELRAAVAAQSNLDAARQAARQRAVVYSNLYNATGELADVMTNADEQSFLHFYSNWIIQNTTIDTETWTLFVTVRQDVPAELQFNLHPGPGLYQVNRLASSMYSCFVNDTRFVDLVRVNLSVDIPGVEGGSFVPLKVCR
jgi:hypothetical protein